MTEEIIWVIILVGIIIHLYAATLFSGAAQDKGYGSYFWLCVVLGPIGWTLVVALPDLQTQEYQQRILAELERLSRPEDAPLTGEPAPFDAASLAALGWVCPKCEKKNPAMQKVCVGCGCARK